MPMSDIFLIMNNITNIFPWKENGAKMQIILAPLLCLPLTAQLLIQIFHLF